MKDEYIALALAIFVMSLAYGILFSFSCHDSITNLL